jgi:uncharacterized protein YukE
MNAREREAVPRPAAPRVEFFGVFTIAALGSFLLSAAAGRWWPALWGAAWMAVYYLIARARSREYVETEDFADNIYYLGFLLTLVALAAVLVRLGDMGDDVLRTVLAQFGLALSTTILGLAGRTALLMARPTLADTEQRAGARVGRAFDEFSRSLLRLTAEADAFAAGFGERLRSSLDRVERAVDEFVVVVATSRERMGAVHGGLDELAAALSGSAAGVRDAGQRMAGDLGLVGRTIEPSLTQIAQRLEESLTRLTALADSVRHTGEDLDAASRDAWGRMRLSLTGVVHEMEQMKNATRLVHAELSNGGGGLAQAVGLWREQAEELARIHALLAQEAAGSSHAVVQVRRALAEAVDEVSAVLRADAPHGPVQ